MIVGDNIAIPEELPSSEVEMKVIRPGKFEDADSIIELVSKNTTVIINCEATDDELAGRILKKIAGHNSDWEIHKVSDTTHIVQRTKC